MEIMIKIGEFAQLTGVTVKTVLHYHKIGLLAEPVRSPNGYRLYGATELHRLQVIKRLKALGFSLEKIKDMLGDPADSTTMRSVLESLARELSSEINTLQARLEKVQKLLAAEPLLILKEDTATFQMVNDIIGTEHYESYPDVREKERQIYEVLDSYEWGLNHQQYYVQLAEYLKDNPEVFQKLIKMNERLVAIADLPEDAQEIDELARDCVRILKCIPIIETMCSLETVNPFDPLLNEMLSSLLTPAQMKFCELSLQYSRETGPFNK
jgi:DNA-binding transcriptional MerR regulator